jgi:cation diffusion facilitator family transporter
MANSGSGSDLEAPLLISEQEDTPSRQNSALRSPKRKWKERPSSSLQRQFSSGRWQFKIHKFVGRNDFDDTKEHSAGRLEYNKKQREAIEAFKQVDEINQGRLEIPVEELEVPEDPGIKRAINFSNGLNFFLLVVKIYASIESGSLVIVASTLDSLLDLVAGFVLWFVHFFMQRKNPHKYPIGKLRIQPVGIVVFAATMATLSLQVLITGVQQLFEGERESMDEKQRIWLISIMSLVICIKFGLYLYCNSFDNDIVSVYAMDHFFDIVTNLVGLAAALLGDYFFWWIDPAGAIFLAFYTIFNWGKTLLENALSLVGQAAPSTLIQKLTYMALNHHSDITRIDTVRAYTFGTFYFVEVDIELPEDMMLKQAHEIGESLQDKLERLPEVERAFVHLDFECEHRPEHGGAELKR